MSTGLNNVSLIGHVGQEPTVTNAGSTNVAKFTIAVNETWFDKVKKERKERVTWVTIVAWGKLAETVGKYIHKGSHVYVQGALQNNNYEKNGVKHYGMQVRCDRVIFLNKVRPDDEGGPPPAGEEQTTDGAEGDIPF